MLRTGSKKVSLESPAKLPLSCVDGTLSPLEMELLMKLTRSELFRKVCELPLSKLGPELETTGTALAAICKQYQIPYPGSGYWTRKSLGLAPDLPVLPEGTDDAIEIAARVVVPRKSRAPMTEAKPSTMVKSSPKRRRSEHHSLLFGVEEHFRKTRAADKNEFLRPWKRLLPDIISSQEALPRAIAIANRLYLAFNEVGLGVQIAAAAENLSRIQVEEREVELTDRKYGRYSFGTIWAPDRPTVVFIDNVPIGLTITEMTERAIMRYVNGDYYREDSKLIRSLKSWQLTHSWTTEQDLPSGRFRIVAYSPKPGVDWTHQWQDSESEEVSNKIPEIVQALRAAKGKLHAMMLAEDEAQAKRKKEQEEEWERYRRREDTRQVEQAFQTSQKQLAEIIDSWGRAMVVERFFADAEVRLEDAEEERKQRLKERLALARQMMGSVDPLDFIDNWQAPEDRYRSKYD
ncbi:MULTISPECIES: hypothetical protein [unclassified Rhizobium]|uniref:hypothetical protein n=2 Tax=unclassified Rhizobium TaxID=2613769 RepID=UPI002B23ACCA|nr:MULTISPECIES: hypothetical protein [unclassified Rhizobium]